VQRKTGFEVELDVPAYLHPPQARRPKLKPSVALSNEEKFAIEAFLGGGLIYSQPYGVHPLGYFHLTADHGGFQSSHAEVVNMMVKNGFVVEPFFFRAMSNLEYVTPPFDEVTPTVMAPIAVSPQEHAVATAEKAALPDAAAIPAPAVDLFTGVPVAALRKLCQGDSFPLLSDRQPAIRVLRRSLCCTDGFAIGVVLLREFFAASNGVCNGRSRTAAQRGDERHYDSQIAHVPISPTRRHPTATKASVNGKRTAAACSQLPISWA
jgi:hypothetical protein